MEHKFGVHPVSSNSTKYINANILWGLYARPKYISVALTERSVVVNAIRINHKNEIDQTMHSEHSRK